MVGHSRIYYHYLLTEISMQEQNLFVQYLKQILIIARICCKLLVFHQVDTVDPSIKKGKAFLNVIILKAVKRTNITLFFNTFISRIVVMDNRNGLFFTHLSITFLFQNVTKYYQISFF